MNIDQLRRDVLQLDHILSASMLHKYVFFEK